MFAMKKTLVTLDDINIRWITTHMPIDIKPKMDDGSINIRWVELHDGSINIRWVHTSIDIKPKIDVSQTTESHLIIF